MKKIFTTLCAVALIGGAAFAQKTADLEVIPYFPEPDSSYVNLAIGDTFYVGQIVKNNGPAAVATTDTLVVGFGGMYINTAGTSYRITRNATGISIPVGGVDTFLYYAIQGDVVIASGPGGLPIKTQWNTNSLDTVSAFINGKNASGLFTDAGYDGTTFSDNNAIGYQIRFGAAAPPTAITTINGLDKSSINVYPNPAKSVLNFKYAFTAATTASVRVMDIAGREVLTQDFGKQYAGERQFTISTAALNAGVYTLEFVTDDKRATSKFTVAK